MALKFSDLANVRGWFKEPIVGSTVIIAAATIVNLFVSIGLWVSTANSVKVSTDSVTVARNVYLAGNRPYVGSENWTAVLDEKKGLLLQATFKNFGTTPAENVQLDFEITIDGKPVASKSFGGDHPATMMPSQILHRVGMIRSNIPAVMSGQSVIEVTASASYDGPAEKGYRYCEKGRYEPSLNAMLNFGRCSN